MKTLLVVLACVGVAGAQAPRPKVRSLVTLADVAGPLQEVICDEPRLFEAPNWSPDGRYLLLNADGKLWKLPVGGGEPQAVATGAVNRINNDHGISPDGKWFAVSAGHIYLVSAAGGEPRQVTSETPSYYHGWSPDGSMLAYCARRGDNFDIYSISRNGGEERRLTTHAAHDDGPDYTPDGRWIYFNSDRSGNFDVWRIPAEGAGPNDARAERITSDEWEDWFPHPSPDGKWLVFLSYEKGTKGHPANQNVLLRRMPLGGGKIETIRKVLGGQGTINVNSWAPDSKRFAYVRYEVIQQTVTMQKLNQRVLAGTFLQLLLLSLWPPARLPAQNIVKNDFRAASGYTFFAPTTSPTSYLIGNDARVVHQWPGNGRAGWVVYLLPNGHILRTGTVTSSVFGGAASSGGRIDEFTWDGSLVWSYTLSTDKHLRHHDIAPLANGNILVFAWEVHTAEEAIAAGRNPNRITGGAVWGEAIFEVRPTRPSGGEAVWEWHVWDHLVQGFDATKKNYGDVAEHPELIDINFGAQTPDWLHFNAITYNPKLDQIMVSSRALGEIWVIDHSTTTGEAAGHSGGRSGKGGDILYRWGNPQTYRGGGAGDQRLFHQHNAHWIEPGLPGEGHILVFNNDARSNFSTVDEIVPPVDEKGAYAHAAGAAFGPEKAAWSYGEDAQPRFQSRTFGGAQRLPNGNTLICVSNAFRIIEVTPEGEVVWGVDIGEATAIGASEGGTFRATRFPVNYDGLRGTELSRAAPSLISAASMLGGPHAPAALATALGGGLAGSTAVAGAVPLPTTLAGTSVDVTDSAGVKRSAALIFVSPAKINFQIPAETAIGPARVTIRAGGGGEQSADIRIDPVAPALFSANADGKGAGAIVALRVNAGGRSSELAFAFDDASKRFVPKPLPLGNANEQLYLLLFGTGIRGAGASGSVAVSIAGQPVPVIGAAAQSEFAGLDQVNVGPLPPSLAGHGEQPVVLTVEQKTANVVWVSFQ